MLGFSWFLYGSLSDQRHWWISPLLEIAMNSECNAAICVKRTGESRSGQSSKSSDIHSGRPDDESFFFESKMRSKCSLRSVSLRRDNMQCNAIATIIFFPLCFLARTLKPSPRPIVLAITPTAKRIAVYSATAWTTCTVYLIIIFDIKCARVCAYS